MIESRGHALSDTTSKNDESLDDSLQDVMN